MARRLQHGLSTQPGMVEAKANPVTGRVLVRFDPEAFPEGTEAVLRERLRAALSAPEAPPASRAAAPVRRLLRRTGADRHETALGPITSAVSAVLAFASAWLSSRLIATVTTGAPVPGATTTVPSLWPLAVTTGLTGLLGVAAEYQDHTIWRRSASAVKHRLRSEAFAKAVSLDMAFADARSPAQLVDAISADTAEVAGFVHKGPGTMVRLLTSDALAIVATLASRPILVPVLLLPVLGIYAAARRFQPGLAPFYIAAAQRETELSELVSGALTGVTTVKSYTAEDHESDRTRRQSQEAIAATGAASAAGRRFGTTMHLLSASSITLFLTKARVDVDRGLLTDDRFFLLQQVSSQVTVSIFDLGGWFDGYQRAEAAAQRLLALLETEPRVQSGPDRLDEAGPRGAIRFDSVSFGYRPDVPVLRDLRLEVAPGETVGLVGATGAGKSTVVKLLLRFYDATDGGVTLDGRPIHRLSLDDLRRSIGYVSQEPYLFAGTVADNIRYGRPDATDAAVVAAATAAAAHEFIERLPEGYDTEVGERGSRLSTGQRQRLAIARALIKDAPVLILDEATASVDNETEAALQDSLERVAADRSLILIAHRLSTVRNADRIYVLDAGAVLEAGRHEELLARDGVYAALWRVQTGGTATT